MANYDIRPLQLKIMEILEVIHHVCEEHGLRYYMIDGTLIGAVRHKGFIPWDDDMDIGMPRADYEKLIAHCKEWLPQRYEMVCYENDPSYPLHFAKIQDAETTLVERPHLYYLGGVFVDVFPIDGAPTQKWRQRLWHLKYQFLRKMLYFSFRDPYKHGHGPSSWAPLIARWIKPMAGWQESIKKCTLEYKFEESEYASVNHEDGVGAMVPRKEVLGEPTPIEFEGRTFWGLANNDYYLTKLFGDYMTPPPADKIHQHHFFYMDLEHPYREFDKSTLSRQ
ncbi:MAG: LicD family protein [Paludibacteraceae bacterium]|nr:LicD family protein [Paludibacteraceae bacterium]